MFQLGGNPEVALNFCIGLYLHSKVLIATAVQRNNLFVRLYEKNFHDEKKPSNNRLIIFSGVA